MLAPGWAPEPPVCKHGPAKYRTWMTLAGEIVHAFICPEGYADRECEPVTFENKWSSLV